MLSMAKINNIKYLKQVQGHSYGTIKKYEETEIFNQTIKKIIRKTKKIDQYKEMVDRFCLILVKHINKGIRLKDFYGYYLFHI